jgi:hypothetical protein
MDVLMGAGTYTGGYKVNWILIPMFVLGVIIIVMMGGDLR